MTPYLPSKTTHESLSARTTVALRLVVALSLAAACFLALAQDADSETQGAAAPAHEFGEVDLRQLERIFWICDHAAATDGVDGPTGMACGNAFEQLKQRKFGGDFAAMLAWWREHKTTEYEAMTLSAQQAEAQADDPPMP